MSKQKSKVGGLAQDGKVYCNYHVVGRLHKAIRATSYSSAYKCSVCLESLSPKGSINPDYICNKRGAVLIKHGPILHQE